MEKLTNNPGLVHISQNIFWHLDHDSLLSCRLVSESWKSQVDQPYFCIRKLDLIGQPKDLRNAWNILIGKIEGDDAAGYLIEEITQILMRSRRCISDLLKTHESIAPIHLAANFGSIDIVKFLASYIENLNIPTAKGATPIFLAAEKGHFKVVEFLASIIESPNALLANGQTPIYIAAQNGHSEVVKVLASITESPNAPVDNGVTPIYIAAEMGHTEVVKVLA